MIASSKFLKSGSFVPLDQLNESDPEKITVRLGRSVSVLRGDADEILEECESQSGTSSGSTCSWKGSDCLDFLPTNPK
jgi:hypothetical protein